MRQAVIYLRVSTIEQTTANQERELREIASRMGCEIVKVYRDHGISGAKGRDKRPAFDKLCRDAARREFDMVMAWSVDRLGRSLQDLVGFLSELHAFKIWRNEFVKLWRLLGGLAYGSLPSGSASIHRQCSASTALSTAQASPWRSR
jgi:hypothetical protein